MTTTPQKDTIWRHRKGGFYTVVDVVIHTETGERIVTYTDEYGHRWARPESQFMDGRFVEWKRVSTTPQTARVYMNPTTQEMVFFS